MTTDMNGKEIKVGSIVKLYTCIGADMKRFGVTRERAEVYMIKGIHSHPEPLLWVKGVAGCYHPLASELIEDNSTTKI